MKRVIVLSWFKKMSNRLFGPDDTNEQENVDYEKTENEIDETLTKPDRKNSTSFRFPIISDAEIYGWDDETTKERNYPEPTARTIEEKDNYETKPLYENEKWPSDTRPVNVYRAESALKYGAAVKDEKKSFSPPKKIIQEDLSSKVKTTVQKRSNKPFTPTAVPSPVYGFTKTRRDATESSEVDVIKLQPLKQEEKEFSPGRQEIQNNEPLVEKEETNYVPMSNTTNYVETDIIEVTSENEVLDTKSTAVEADIIIEPNHLNQPVNEIQEIESIIVESDIIETVPVCEGIEIEPQSVEEESIGIISDVAEHTKKEHIETETAALPETAELAEEQVSEAKKERIVPFNVLMLKSDKEKMKAEKPFSPELVVESKPIKQDVAISQTPVINVKEEKLADAVEITSETVEEDEEEEPYYAFPSLDYLIPPESQIEDTEWLESQSEKLEEALSHFAVKATVIEAMQGPTVTRFELTVGVGTKVSKVRNLTDDLKLALAAEDIRIQAPIPGRSSIGIEIPNRKTRPVRISEVIATEQFRASTSPLEAVLGLSLTGTPVTLDLRKMPHGMIAGATGSGKSVCINSILVSLLYKASPKDLKMMLIDPKMVELAPFNGIPHLISPVITDVKAATAALKWAVAEMERRYELLAHAGVRDIERYNKAVVESRRFSLKMPYLLIVIDELADLMMMAPADVEVSISRIAQKARACGIHLIIATQRPSVDVITGTIKANIPTRVAFSVSSQIDSRTIIDSPGAERLLGKGDMLYIGNGQSSSVRLQGTFVTDEEIERIIEHVQNEASPDYLFGQDDLLASSIEEEGADSLFEEACLFIHETGSASTSLLQRNFSIGYNRAAKLMDRMEKNGFISGPRGSKARDVFLTESDLDRLTDRSE
jgi:S-DNA-T family DNA segregation ATPase FtsK/SpoIIIE